VGYITADRNQEQIIGYSLEDFVEENSKARFVAKIVEELNTKELYSRYSKQGGEAYDPKIMLAIWFLGYCETITTTRKLEYNCKKHLDFIYISANLRPDHSSLSRFRQKNLDLIPKYFIEIIRIANNKGISQFKEIAIDGTKIISASSKRKSMKEQTLNRYIEKAKKDITDYMERVGQEDKKYKSLKAKEEKLLKAREELKKRQEKIKPSYREKHQVNTEEPDACMFYGYNQSGYNAQAGTDTSSQIIVSAEVVQDRNDEKQFIKQYNNVIESISEDKERAYVADSGYNSHAQIEQVTKQNINAYISDRYTNYKTEEKIAEGKQLNKTDFRYDKQRDVYVCPAGKLLRKETILKDKTVYSVSGCKSCKIKELCLAKGNKKGKRVINRDKREEMIEAMIEKTKSEYARGLMRRRSQSVEAVFGNIKSNMNYGRFRLKGIEKVNSEFKLMCIGHNLNKMFKILLDKKGGFFLNKTLFLIVNFITSIKNQYFDNLIIKTKFCF